MGRCHRKTKKNSLKDTLEKLELSYISLEDEYKEIFLDIACILNGEFRKHAIRVLDSCGYHARNGLKVLEQRSLITISLDMYNQQVLGMNDHMEEMGKNIVRRSHPDEPNKHSRLWIDEEIEDILANDKGTEATRCLKLNTSGGNNRILMKGFGKMKKLQYLEVKFAFRSYDYHDTSQLDDSTQYFPNSVKYLKCMNYPFLYLPKTFQADNLVELEMNYSRRMVQLWEEQEKKVDSKLTTFNFRITPNLETSSLNHYFRMPVSCRKLKHLNINHSKLRTFDLRLTPNLETLSLERCAQFEELHVSVACPNLKFLSLSSSRLRSLYLELIPNLEMLDLQGCEKLVEINAPVGCMKKVVELNLRRCVLLEKLPEDIGRFECLKELVITDTRISHLPHSILGLKGLRIAASSKLLQLYDFPSEIKTTTEPLLWELERIQKLRRR